MTGRSARQHWLRRVTVVALVTAFFGAGTVSASGIATGSGAHATLAPAVTSQLAEHDRVSVWVVLKDTANLAPAASLRTKTDKDAFVYGALTRQADRSQAGLRELPRRRKARFTSFWITNAIHLDADRALIDEIARRPEVSRIEAEPARKPATRPATEKQTALRTNPLPPTSASRKTERATAAEADPVEWNLKRVGADQAWNDFGVRGEGIVVANIDTGVKFDHPALVHSYRGTLSNDTTDHNYNWFDAFGLCPTAACDDDSGHGTHVMGIEVGSDEAGGHQIGVAPGARWIAATSSSDEQGRLATGQWMLAPTDLNGRNPRPDLAPDVVNNSWAHDGTEGFFGDVIDAWVAAGIFPVFAAGNKGIPGQCSTNTWPASFPNAYAVGNTNQSNQVSHDSSHGPAQNGEVKPDISAPGVGIRASATWPDYKTDDGTSEAAPHVAGAVALLWSASPELQGNVAATAELLNQTARPIDDTSCGGTAADNNAAGHGLLDIPAALRAAPHGPTGGLRGQVTTAGTGTPVPDATVVLSGPRTRDLASDGKGGLRLDRMLPGRYDYRVDAFGYQPATGTVTVEAGDATTLTVSLQPQASATLSGVVTSAEGPVDGATVSAVNTPAQARTDASGRYQLTLPLGTHSLTFQAPGRCALPADREVTVSRDAPLDVTLDPRTDDTKHYTCTSPVVDYQAGNTRLDLSGSDGPSTQVSLPFPVRLYNGTSSTAWISADGAVGLSEAPAQAPARLFTLPDSSDPNNAIYPFYSPLTVDAQGGVYTSMSADQVVVEWRNVEVQIPVSGSEAPTRISVSLVIRPDGSFTVNYRGVGTGSMTAGRNAWIGLEAPNGDDAFVYGNAEPVVTEGLGFTIRATG